MIHSGVTGNAGGPWSVTFQGTHAGQNVPPMQGDAATTSSGTLARTLSFAYDAANQLLTASDPAAAYTFAYDNLGRPTSITHDLASLSFDVVMTQTFDAASNRTSLAATINGVADFKNTYTYDALHRLTRLDQTGQTGGNAVAEKRIDLEYNALGQFTKISRYKDTDGGSTNEVATALYTYDTLNRLTGLDYEQGGVDLFTPYSWTYDALHRTTDFTSQDGTTTYAYDATSQLVGADHSYQTDETYSYDANGNRTNAGYSTGTNNQLLSDGTYNYAYDDEGNRTERTHIASGAVTEYVWDHRNRLVSVIERDSDTGPATQTVDFAYDIFDRRIAKTVDADGDGSGAAESVYFVYDGLRHERGFAGDHLALQFDDNGDLTHRYLHNPQVTDQIFADEQVTSLTTPGDVSWPLADNQGTIRDVVDSSGAIQKHRKYDAFGNVTSDSAPTHDFLFAHTARELDQELGLTYLRARYYDPAAGRFLSQDPLGFRGLDTNLTRYAANSPSNLIDASGLTGRLPPPLPMTSEEAAAEAERQAREAFAKGEYLQGVKYHLQRRTIQLVDLMFSDPSSYIPMPGAMASGPIRSAGAKIIGRLRPLRSCPDAVPCPLQPPRVIIPPLRTPNVNVRIHGDWVTDAGGNVGRTAVFNSHTQELIIGSLQNHSAVLREAGHIERSGLGLSGLVLGKTDDAITFYDHSGFFPRKLSDEEIEGIRSALEAQFGRRAIYDKPIISRPGAPPPKYDTPIISEPDLPPLD